MGILAKGDTTKTKKYTHESGDFLVLRTQVNAGDEDDIADLTAPTYRVDGEGIVTEVETHANRVHGAFFDVLAEGWSLTEGEGNESRKPTLQDYRELTKEARAWVDECVSDAIGTVRRRAEGKAKSRTKRKSSRTSSSAEPESS